MNSSKNDKFIKIGTSILMLIALILGVIPNSFSNAIESKNNTDNSNNSKVNESVSNKTIKYEKYDLSVAYNSHVQDKGWEKDFSKTNGQESGTTGQNKKNEAIKIKLLNAPKNVKIKYQAHVQDIGWQSWKYDGEIAGTTGQNKRIEAIKIQLEGISEYSVEYRTHIQDIGWQDWKTDGDVSGTTGLRLKIEAIEIRIISKKPSIIYQSHVQDIGWQQYYNNGQTSGTTGKNLKVEAMRIAVKGVNFKVKYKSFIQGIGWENSWKQNGQLTGTSGQNKRMEAIKIELNENDSYSVQYRVHLQDIGWQDWKTDGEIAGTTDKHKKIEAIEIKLISKIPSNKFEVKYQTHVQDIGWTKYSKQGETSGVTGKGLKVEAIKLKAVNIPQNSKILYMSHVQDLGWEKAWKTIDEQSGTTGQNKKIEAVRIKLENCEKYSIKYRTYLQNIGWQEWVYDGEISGTTGQNRKLEAIEIEITEKVSPKYWIYLDADIPSTANKEKYKIKGWVMTNVKNTKLQITMDNKVQDISIKRTNREDVLNTIKGYGGDVVNSKPGFETEIDLNSFNLGNKIFKIQLTDEKGKVLKEISKNIKIIEKGKYGSSGLKKAGRGGYDLEYLKYGNGPNVFFGTYAIHGFEDKWEKDGDELVKIANNFYNKLLEDNDSKISEKWTIYLFPGVNQDGLRNGWTNNGPGRTTLYSMAPNNKGIDLNRCWQIGNDYKKYTDSRNYNGTAGFQAYEAQQLRDFLINHKSKKGQTVLVDLHGWTQQLIGNEQICSFYQKQFPENDRSAVGRYGTGYLINWARVNLGSSYGVAKTALIELPDKAINGVQSVINNNLTGRYISSTLDMLRNI